MLLIGDAALISVKSAVFFRRFSAYLLMAKGMRPTINVKTLIWVTPRDIEQGVLKGTHVNHASNKSLLTRHTYRRAKTYF